MTFFKTNCSQTPVYGALVTPLLWTVGVCHWLHCLFPTRGEVRVKNVPNVGINMTGLLQFNQEDMLTAAFISQSMNTVFFLSCIAAAAEPSDVIFKFLPHINSVSMTYAISMCKTKLVKLHDALQMLCFCAEEMQDF